MTASLPAPHALTVHDAQAVIGTLAVRQAVVLLGHGVLNRVAVIDAIHLQGKGGVQTQMGQGRSLNG